MIAKLIVLSCLLSVALAGTAVKKCTENQPFPLEVRVYGCDVPPCVVVKGTFIEFDIDFVANNYSTSMSSLVRATTLGLTVPYDLPEDVSNVCSNLMYGAYCPVYPEEDVTYKFLFFINNVYPEIGVKIEISIVNQDNDILTCFLCDIKVRKGKVNGEGGNAVEKV